MRRCIAIMGPTATGKSDAGIALAERFDGEIISMDSRQVYRGFDIGTAKVTMEERRRVPHHLVDLLEPDEQGSAGRHAALAASAAAGIVERKRLPILVGGTGLYFRSFFEGLIDVSIPRHVLLDIRAGFAERTTADLYEELVLEDPERAADLSRNDRIRIMRALELIAWTGRTVTRLYAEQKPAGGEWDVLGFVLTMPRLLLRGRIAQRTRELFDRGWPEEVERLLERGVPLDAPGMNSLGYRDIARALLDGRPAESVLEDVVTATQQYAKRQETFFRRERTARRIDVSEEGWLEDVLEGAERFLAE